MQDYMNCFLKLIKVNKAKQLKDISKIINLLSWSKSDEKDKFVKINMLFIKV